MENLLNLYNQLDPTMKFYWGVAVITSTIFVVQTILTFVGLGDSDVDVELNVDASGDGTLDTGGALQLFRVRNIINFLLGLGWGGVCFASSIPNRALLVLAAVATGCAFVVIFAILFRQTKKLEANGAFRIGDCVGQTCDVYLRIPATRQGQGKVQVSFGGSVQELAAVTDGETLRSGAKVRVLSLVDNHTVLVEKI